MDTSREFLEATLRRGSLGIVDAVRYARIPHVDNLLVVVDQFEELFRFRRSRQIDNSRDEAIAFVSLLLEATKQSALPIYVVLTMRSDFIGDCIEYPGLPDAVNNGQYLVPRMTRDQVRLAITGPVGSRRRRNRAATRSTPVERARRRPGSAPCSPACAQEDLGLLGSASSGW